MRQVGAVLVAGFVFFATIAALSVLLKNKDTPAYLDNVTTAISNLFTGAFGK